MNNRGHKGTKYKKLIALNLFLPGYLIRFFQRKNSEYLLRIYSYYRCIASGDLLHLFSFSYWVYRLISFQTQPYDIYGWFL